MQYGFPAVTTKKLMFKSVKSELLWFIDGGRDSDHRLDNNKLKELNKSRTTIWSGNENSDYWKQKAKFSGDMGLIYGSQWRHWVGRDGEAIDQLQDVIERLKTNPDDRRHVVNAWNPSDLNDMALPPCHMNFQFFHENGNLSLSMAQRSCDMFLGVPFNIASYALLLHMVAQVVDLNADELIINLGDAHIYNNHMEQVKEQLSRKPFKAPTLSLNKEVKDIDKFTMDDIELIGYESHDPIKASLAV